jgi:UDP-N-acetylmuramate dehydrogenase
MQLSSQYNLSNLNTLSLPGRAEYFSCFSSISQLLSLLQQAKALNLDVKVLGGGSNIILQPRVSGLVIQSTMQRVQKLAEDDGFVTYAVDAGLGWHQWVLKSIELGAYGLENLALIPGTVGASPVQNIGAYGVEVGQFIAEVRGIQLSTGQWMSFSAECCNFSYRDSVFKQQFKNDFLITQVIFKLSKVFNPQISYAPLKQLAEAAHDVQGGALSARKVAGWVIGVRNSKLPNPAEIPNAGSFFTNPIIQKSQSDVLLKRYPMMPVYPVMSSAKHEVKVAAGWLIDQCGWKGKSLGLAKMHDQQALVLTLQAGATQQDLLAIQYAVQRDVMARFGIQLHPEPQPFA